MDNESQDKLARLIRSQRVAALGTLREGGPLVSMILYATAPDFACFYIHASRLAQHTQDILQEPRVSLMIAETDANVPDPLQLARLSIRGEAVMVPTWDAHYETAKSLYLAKFPQAAMLFEFKDFNLYAIEPKVARYVAGFGKAFNLGLSDFKTAAAIKR